MEFITLFGTPKREPTVFEKIKDAVKQTKANFTEQIQDLVQGKKEIDAEMLEDLEAIMISADIRSEEHTSELQSLAYLVCRLLLEKKKTETRKQSTINNIHLTN